MPHHSLHIVILAAGKGTRMNSSVSKVCHPIGGRALLDYVLDTAQRLQPAKITCVVSPDMPQVEQLIKNRNVPNINIAYQRSQEGTGHAVLAARDFIKGSTDDLMVLYGDTPLLTADTLQELVTQRQSEDNPAVVVLGMIPSDPNNQYGRLVLDDDDCVEEIVEYKVASEEQRFIRLCNSGVMLIDGDHALDMLDKIDNKNAQQEYLLTDVVAIARAADRKVHYVEGDEDELLGINSRVDQALAEDTLQHRWRVAALEQGVTMTDPASVFLSFDTKVGKDVTIQPNVFIGPGVTIEDGVTIRSNCYIQEAYLHSECVVGPFAHIRPGSNIGSKAKIGNFVEIKKSDIHEGAKVNHLSYIGDAEVGERANIGAGTITCNYDGFEKHRTKIGSQAFIGSNSCLVAPVDIGDKSIVGAGSVITRKVLPDALAYSRPPQQEIISGATRYRRKRTKLKVVNK
ncbi:MAG: bifunctional UDP-N-acetylglucosamine diphosphorylase/glucosamine-1-phosphate N-acetyltransferase GlmU [Alphaproteobacteria bacterium]